MQCPRCGIKVYLPVSVMKDGRIQCDNGHIFWAGEAEKPNPLKLYQLVR